VISTVHPTALPSLTTPLHIPDPCSLHSPRSQIAWPLIAALSRSRIFLRSGCQAQAPEGSASSFSFARWLPSSSTGGLCRFRKVPPVCFSNLISAPRPCVGINGRGCDCQCKVTSGQAEYGRIVADPWSS
jgi:hypothetical protein